ncbi:DUF948 domain-containing protein [Bacillus carboniphilus]|uniref:DUF948 domain-containing protein n=1 Tax=Bacillus carboniphilus TaxID=86663 RepID=A0ABN0WCK9_9BACI
MEIILYLSIALIAVAFFILVIYVVKTLKSLQKTLDSVAHTLDGLEGQMRGVTSETTELLKKTNALAEDIQHKSENLNSVVVAVKDVGTSIQRFNRSIDGISDKVIHQVETNQDKISQVVQWSNVFLELKQRWDQRKGKQSNENSEPKQENSGKQRVYDRA